MNKEFIEKTIMKNDGSLYHDGMADTIESIIPNPYASCHAADLIELPNGDILCCWFAGSDEGNSDISIVLSRLNKDSSTWTIPVMVSDDATRSEQNPSLFLASDSELWLVYTAQVARSPEIKPIFNLQYTAEIRCKKSHDNGYTWEKTEVLFEGPGAFCRQKIQKLSSGRWIFGNWICFDDDTHNGSDITVFRISENQGSSWETVEMPESRGRVHANIIEIKPGHLVALMRSRFADFIYRSESKDNGNSWSVPVKTELPNNNSSISAIKLQSGRICLIYNHYQANLDVTKTVWPYQRYPVAVAISDDNGITWPFRRILDLGEGYFGVRNDLNNTRYEYPVIMQSKDGNIHAAYSYKNRKNIKYVVFNEAWVLGSKEANE